MSRKIEIEFNDEIDLILSKIHPSNRDTAVNYAVSLFIKTKIFKEFFLLPEHRPSTNDPLEVILDTEDDDETVVLSQSGTVQIPKKELGPAITANNSSGQMIHRDVGVSNSPTPVIEKVSWDKF